MSYVAVASAVIGVGTQAYSAYSANKQAKQANNAAGAFGDQAGNLKKALGADPEDLYGTKFIPEEYKSNIGKPGSIDTESASRAMGSVKGSLPDLLSLTKDINIQNATNANRLTGGQFSKVLRGSGADISQMLKGQVPQDVVESINRLVAEHLGGAVNPSSVSGGFDMSTTASDTARRLGITSFDIMQKGLSFAPAWQQSVQSFLYRPEQAARDFLFPQQSANLAAAALQEGVDTSQYYSRNNLLRAESAPDPQARGKLDDALKLLAIQTGAQGNAAAANQGLVDSIGSLGTSAANLGRQVSGYYNPTNPAATGTPYQAGVNPVIKGQGPQSGTYYV